MKAKDYLRRIEDANEIVKLADREDKEEYKLCMEFDNYKIFTAKTWEEFMTTIKETFIPVVANIILNCDTKLNTNNVYIATENHDNFALEFWIE